eukprot:PITA_09670
MQVSLERELQLHVVEELLVLKEEEPQTDAEQPHAEVPGVETSTQVESSKEGQKLTREVDRLLLDVRENLNQAMVQPTKMFWKVAKHVLGDLRGTSQYGLWYRRIEGVKLQGFTDADWAGSTSDQKGTSRGIFNLGSTIVSWYSRKQRSVVLSSAEAEYMDASQSCIKLSKNPIFHDRSKHIDIQYHHLKDYMANRIMLLQYISTEEQDVDILTKALSKCKFKFHRDKIGVENNPFPVEREC